MDDLDRTRTPVAGQVGAEDRPGAPPKSIAAGIILNPTHSATLRAYAELVPELRKAGVRCRSMTTSVERSGRWQAEQLIEWGADTVIILGGDGTIRAAAPVLAEAGTPTFLIPTGTANVLGRHIGLRSPRQAIDHCVHNVASMLQGGPKDDWTHLRGIPINIAEFQTADGARHESVFISLAGIGGDARAVAHHHSAPGPFGYAWGAARALFAADFTASAGNTNTTAVRSTAGRGGSASAPVWSVMASKLARPAGPIAVFPQARIDAETFSVLTVGPIPDGLGARCRAWSGIATACLQGRPQAHPLMDYRGATETSVSTESPVPAHLDGDLIGDCVELRVSAGDKKLRVSAPTS